MSSRWLTVGACLVALFAGLAFGDRETAEFFAARGDKAVRARKFDEAQQHYERALKEDPAYHPARFGLAEALLGSDQQDEAVAEFRRFIAAARATQPLPDAWKRLVAKADRRLQKLDAAGVELGKIIDAYADSLVALARKWEKKDQTVAVTALRRVLDLRPEHAGAAKMLEKLGLSAKGPPIQLFNGKDFRGWLETALPRWQCRDGVMVVNVKDAAYIARHEKMFEGDYDARMEARLVEEHEGPTLFALTPAYDGKDGHYTLGVLKGRILWQDDISFDAEREVLWMSPSNLKQSFDKTGWNSYELRFRGGEVEAFVNGESIGTDKCAENRLRGFVGLKVQNCKVEIRKVEVVLR